MSDHAELSPSRRHRWAACPGSVREEARFPEPPAGQAAIDGTRSHALLEECIKGNVYVIPDFAVGAERTDEYGTWTVDANRVERVNFALRYVKERALAAKTVPVSETKVFPDGLVGRADMSGTVDVQIPGTEVFELIDYKDGMAPVVVERNPQMEQYIVGKLAELETPPLVFRVTIIQPKLALKGMPAITSWDITSAEVLERVVPTLIKQAAATDDPNAPLVPGEDQCKYCRAKATCPALNGSINEVFAMFAPVNQSATEIQAVAQADPQTMAMDQMVKVMQMAPLMRKLIEGVEERIQAMLEAGQDVPGFKLVRGKGSRTWALPEAEMVKKLTGMGIPKEKLYESKLITPAKAEKLTWEKKGEACKLSDIQLKRLSTEYIAQQPGKPTIAPASDPREPIVMNAAPMFGAIEQPIIEVSAEVITAPLPEFLAAVYAPQPDPVPDWLAVPAWLQ